MLNIGLIIVVFSCASFKIQSAKMFNVIDYGAKGDGVTDNSQAFIKCLNDAVKAPNSVVLVPYGKYKISVPIDFYFTDQSLEIRGVLKSGQKPVVFTDNFITILSIRGYSFPDLSKGVVSINNLKLSGKKSIYTAQHPFVKTSKFFYGVYVADKSKVYIKNVEVENIYGQGIGIISTNQKMAGNGRFSYVSVVNSKVINCWGYNPKIDNYGDGIYIANAKAGQVVNNTVNNNPNVTKQLGRGGIVLEYFADNILVQNNQVSGYDRALHIEETNGGQKIIGNNLSGTDLGIVVYENQKCNDSAALLIQNNLVNNLNFNKSLKVDRVRMPRSMLNFLANGNCRTGTIIEGNTFVIDNRYQFLGNSFINILASNLMLKNNKFLIKSATANKAIYLINDDSENTKFVGNTFDGVSLRNKFKVNTTILTNQNNFLRGAKIE